MDVQLTNAKSGLAQAKEGVNIALEQLDLTKAGASQEQVDSAKNNIDQASAAKNLQQAQIANARAAIASVDAQINKTIIKAPINGVVGTLPHSVGELVSPGMDIASIINTDGLQVKSFIDATDLVDISVGQFVRVSNIATGTIVRVAPQIDPITKKVEIVIAIEPSDTPFVVGQFVDIAIERPLEQSYPLIPLDAVQMTATGAHVFIVSASSTVETLPVELGSVIGESVEITNGLEEGLFIVKSTRGLSTGESVSTTVSVSQ